MGMILRIMLVALLAVTVSGCAAIAGIFKAGVWVGVIVALAVSLQYVASGARRAEAEVPLLRLAPLVAGAGLLLALAVGFFPVLTGKPIFTHWPPPGVHPITIGTLELLTAVVFDVGVFLLVVGVLVILVHQLARDEPPAAP